MFSLICFTILVHKLISVWAIVKENLAVFFSVCITNIRQKIDSEFKIGETIWWICCKNSNSNSTLFQILKGSGDDCKALCRKTPGCSGYTYVGDENPKYCYLNSDKGIFLILSTFFSSNISLTFCDAIL